MTQISTSYPYLSIAKKHGVDYGDVLAIADSLNRSRTHDTIVYSEFHADLIEAHNHFIGIREGRIPFPGG